MYGFRLSQNILIFDENNSFTTKGVEKAKWKSKCYNIQKR